MLSATIGAVLLLGVGLASCPLLLLSAADGNAVSFLLFEQPVQGASGHQNHVAPVDPIASAAGPATVTPSAIIDLLPPPMTEPQPVVARGDLNSPPQTAAAGVESIQVASNPVNVFSHARRPGMRVPD